MILDFSQPIILEPAPSSRSNTTIEYQKEQYLTPVVHLAENHLVQKRPLSAKLFRAKFNHPKVQLAQNSVL